jgi:hypothetical protein
MALKSHPQLPCLLLLVFSMSLDAQITSVNEQQVDVTAKLATTQHEAAHRAVKAPPAVIWLKPVRAGSAPAVTPGNFTLLQKNRMFTPHLQVKHCRVSQRRSVLSQRFFALRWAPLRPGTL